MLTKCFTLLKVGHETFFLQDLDPHPDRGAYPSNLVSPSTSPQLVSVFSLLSPADPSPYTLSEPHVLPTSCQRVTPPTTFLLLPSHQFCAHPTLHRLFSSLQGQKPLLSEGKQPGFDRVWVFLLFIQFIFCQFNDLWGQISICVRTREGTGARRRGDPALVTAPSY